MKRETIRTVVTLSLVVFGVASTVIAQGQGVVRAKIPFSFNVAGKSMPAGEYLINKTGQSSLFLIRGESKAAYVLTNSKNSTKSVDKTKLVFRRYGDQYFLGQMWSRGESSGVTFPVTGAERKIINSRPDRHLAMVTEPEEVTILLD